MKRQYGAGNIEEYAPGKWRVRTRIEGKIKTIGTGLSKRQAEEYANAVVAVRIRTEGFTMRNLVELVRAERLRNPELKPSTIRGERSIWDAIASHFGQQLVTETDRRAVKDWLKRTTNANTRRNRLNCLRTAFAHAIDLELIKHNPCEGLKPGKVGKLSKSELMTNLIHPGHQAALIQELLVPQRLRLSVVPKQDELRRRFLLASVLFALGTGCRLSEQWGVKREDVSPDGVTICRSEANAAPKSGDWRTVPLLPATQAALRILASLRREVPALASSAWLFPGWRGEQRRWNKPPKGWHEMLRAARVPVRPWHWLRHTCATALVAGWWSESGEPWSLEEARALLGHASVTTTEIYAQLLDDKAFRAAEKTFQKRSSLKGPAAIDFSSVFAESQLGESDPRPTVYETAGTVNVDAGLASESLQNWSGPDLAWARRAVEASPAETFGPWNLDRRLA